LFCLLAFDNCSNQCFLLFIRLLKSSGPFLVFKFTSKSIQSSFAFSPVSFFLSFFSSWCLFGPGCQTGLRSRTTVATTAACTLTGVTSNSPLCLLVVSLPSSPLSLSLFFSCFQGFIRGARFCEYTGKFHCRTCHTNQASTIPARVLFNWDFRLYRVSDRAKEFIDMMWKEPVFDVSVINVALFDKVRSMLEMRLLRTQLSYVRDFLYTCRLSGSLVQQTFDKNSHIVNFVDMYSLEDFVEIQNGSLLTFVKSATSSLIAHVFSCEVRHATISFFVGPHSHSHSFSFFHHLLLLF